MNLEMPAMKKVLLFTVTGPVELAQSKPEVRLLFFGTRKTPDG